MTVRGQGSLSGTCLQGGLWPQSALGQVAEESPSERLRGSAPWRDPSCCPRPGSWADSSGGIFVSKGGGSDSRGRGRGLGCTVGLAQHKGHRQGVRVSQQEGRMFWPNRLQAPGPHQPEQPARPPTSAPLSSFPWRRAPPRGCWQSPAPVPTQLGSCCLQPPAGNTGEMPWAGCGHLAGHQSVSLSCGQSPVLLWPQ